MIDTLAFEYSRRSDKNALSKITVEIEKLETEFSDAQNQVQVYLDKTLDNSASFKSQNSAKEVERDRVEFGTDLSRIWGHKFASEQQKTFVQASIRLEEQYLSMPYQKSTTKSEPNTIGNDLW